MEWILNRNTKTKGFNKHYNFSVGSCHAKTAIRHDYVEMLKKMKKDIPIEYVRFHGIFCDDMHTRDNLNDVLDLFPNGERYVEENFYMIGVAYDNLLECGVKPFVELSFMPTSLAKEESTTKGFYAANMSEPKDYEEWANYIESFIEFLVEKYGVEEIKSWYFEVWNEPDLYGAFFKGDQSAYFKLYKYTVNAIKKVCSELKVGGPSTSASRWIKSFLDYCKQEKLPLDFVTTHQYPGDPFIGVDAEEVVKDPNEKADKLKKNIKKLEAMIPEKSLPLDVIRMMFGDPTETKEIPDNIFRENAKKTQELLDDLPLYYTEWNLSAVFSAYSNDTKKAASYIIKTSLDVEPYVTGTSLWCFSDVFEEMHQFKEEFHGGFGLQTIHGISKPSYYAMKFLSALPEERYDIQSEYENNIHIGAFKEKNKDHILISRHSMKSIDCDPESIHIKLEAGEGSPEVSLKRIDDEHCNPLKLWEEMGKKKYLNQEDLSELKIKSTDLKETLEVAHLNGDYAVELILELNDVYYLTVEWS
ncbi:MAG: GH39 family glycosyl hydrolase [Lactovum sp.]